MRVLGIDPGLVRTGWAVVEPAGRRLVVRDYGLVAPRVDAELPARLAEGAAQLRAVVAAQAPDLATLEEVFTAPRHPRSALLMAHMRGVICLLLEEAHVPIVPMTATTVKQRLTGAGHASKEQVQRMVLHLTGLDPAAHLRWDVTDALALAIAGLNQESASGRPTAGGRHRGRRLPDRFANLLAEATRQAERPSSPVPAAPPPTTAHV